MMGSMAAAPVNLSAALATFAEIYSPRIVGRVNDYDIRIAHAKGEHVWHVHEHTDEFFLVLDGTFAVALREADGGERTVTLRQGDIFVVPGGAVDVGGDVALVAVTGAGRAGRLEHQDRRAR